MECWVQQWPLLAGLTYPVTRTDPTTIFVLIKRHAEVAEVVEVYG